MNHLFLTFFTNNNIIIYDLCIEFLTIRNILHNICAIHYDNITNSKKITKHYVLDSIEEENTPKNIIAYNDLVSIYKKRKLKILTKKVL